MQHNTLIRIAARTDKGKIRYHNEDTFLVGSDLSNQNWRIINEPFTSGPLGSLMVVADGMGGANAGEVASQIATEAIKKYFSQLSTTTVNTEDAYTHLQIALMLAHRLIVQHAARHPDCEGMGTTILLVWVIDNKAYIGWSGDSRCYHYYPSSGLKLLIDDHSLVWEMVMKGELTEDEAAVHDDRNIITQSLGSADYPPNPEFRSVELKQGDRLLLCSDGLNSMLLDREINVVLSQNEDIATNCAQLIEAANRAGGEDNITVVLFEMVADNDSQKFISPPKTKPIIAGTWRNVLLWSGFLVLLLIGTGEYWWYRQQQNSLTSTPETPVQQDTAIMQPQANILSIADTAQLQNDLNNSNTSLSFSPKSQLKLEKNEQILQYKAELKNLKVDLEVYQKKYEGFYSQFRQLQAEIHKQAQGIAKIDTATIRKQKLQAELKKVEINMDLWQRMINEKQADIDKTEKIIKSNI